MNFLPDLNHENKITLKYYFRKIHGFDTTKSQEFCAALGLAPTFPYKLLTIEDKKKLTDLFTYYTEPLAGDLQKQHYLNIKMHKDLRSYRGIRHSLSLPVRGQNTKNNAKTQKWKKKK